MVVLNKAVGLLFWERTNQQTLWGGAVGRTHQPAWARQSQVWQPLPMVASWAGHFAPSDAKTEGGKGAFERGAAVHTRGPAIQPGSAPGQTPLLVPPPGGCHRPK